MVELPVWEPEAEPDESVPLPEVPELVASDPVPELSVVEEPVDEDEELSVDPLLPQSDWAAAETAWP